MSSKPVIQHTGVVLTFFSRPTNLGLRGHVIEDVTGVVYKIDQRYLLDNTLRVGQAVTFNLPSGNKVAHNVI